jgi:NTP pyrophosphatase (non-canonical NTP hydrolase)
MKPADYMNAVMRTENSEIKQDIDSRITHGIMGIASEGGELLDTLKASMFYGKKLDEVNIKEELGDLMWFTAITLKAMGSSFEEIMDININKLKKRYPDGFSEHDALNRDLKGERVILEDQSFKVIH